MKEKKRERRIPDRGSEESINCKKSGYKLESKLDFPTEKKQKEKRKIERKKQPQPTRLAMKQASNPIVSPLTVTTVCRILC